jgi:DNA polymerase family A
MSGNFARAVVADFEYEVGEGDLPSPLCMVAYLLDENLQHVRTVQLWRGEFGSAPPFDIGNDTLFVAYSAWAEMTCFHVLGWKFPAHIFDQHTAYLAATNVLLPYDPDRPKEKQTKKLADACRAYGIEGWENIEKGEIARAIGEGRWQEYGKEAVLAYCEEDVRNSTMLLRRQLRGNFLLPAAPVERILYWSNYSAKAIALIQARGIPIDTRLWNLVQENRAAVINALRRQFEPDYGTENSPFEPDGRLPNARMRQWLARAGVTHWPHLEDGRLVLDSDAFRQGYNIPGVRGIHLLRDSMGFIAKARLPIGRDGRNRPSLFPFGTATGRNAQARSPYNAHAGVRGFIKFPGDKIGAYLDWRTQEVGIVAALSEDEALIQAYRDGDVYYALAKLLGLANGANLSQWKRDNRELRDRMKIVQLAMNYGQGVPSMARTLDRHPLIASVIIEKHRRTYPRFWAWRDNVVRQAMLERKITALNGWTLRLSSSPNKRALVNFPAQGNGAVMLQEAARELCRAGLTPSMLVHDGILLELDRDEQVEHAKEIMRAAGRKVCNGLEIGADEDQLLQHGERYRDKRPDARAMWVTIMKALLDVRAISEGEYRENCGRN